MKAAELKAHASTEEFKLTLFPASGGKGVPLTLSLTGTAFQALEGCSPGIAIVHYTFGGKKGSLPMPVYLARAMFISGRRCCANVISMQYGTGRAKARTPKKQ